MFETNETQSDPAIRVARINMIQAIIVAVIGALAGIITTLVVRKTSGADASMLHNAFRWVYLDKSVDNVGCVNAAIHSLDAYGAKGLYKADNGQTVYSRDGSNLTMIACRAEHGVAIISITGQTPVSNLFTGTLEIKTHMDMEVTGH
jgi:hypothetical protein